jgi:hypothetical protein
MPDPRDRDIRLRRLKWRLRFVPPEQLIDAAGDQLDGLCDPPEYARRRIRIRNDITGEVLFETMVHEMVHACLWDACETAVEESARDITRGILPDLESIVDHLG